VADWARAGVAKLPRPVDIMVEFPFEVLTDKQNWEIEMRGLLKMLKMEVMIGEENFME